MKRFHIFAAISITLGALGSQTHAEQDWKAQLAGLDGVSVACISSTKQKYGKLICDKLSEHIDETLAGGSFRVEVAGYFKEGEAPLKPAAMGAPLDIRIFIRGTQGNIPAILTRIRASVSYAEAVESGGPANPRNGELVIWEEANVGSGPRKRLPPAIIEVMKQKMAELLDG